MRKNFIVSNADTNEAISQALEYIHGCLADLKLNTKDRNRTELMCEEALVTLLKHSDFSDTGTFTVNISKFLGSVSIKLTVPGQEFALTGVIDDVLYLDSEDISPEAAESIRNILLRSFSQNLRYRHSGKHNIITIRAVRSSYSGLYAVLGALISAVIAGLLMRAYVPEGVYMSVNDNIFVPVRTIFMNGLKLCAIPVVFLSIASCMADSGSLSGIKRTGGKILSFFLSTQIISLMIGFVLMLVFRVGEGAGLTASSSVNAQAVSVSVLDTLVNVIPSDIVRPFLDGNMLQLIALAVILGICAGLSGARSVTQIFTELNGIFTKATEIFLKAIPAVIFCSITSMLITTGTAAMLSVLGIILTLLSGYVMLHLMYILMLKFIARVRPVRVYREAVPMIFTAMSTCSSIAALPDAISTAKKLGIPSSIYSFTIPLGISVFKNESCLFFVVGVMSAANMYGVQFTYAKMFSLGVSVLMLASATPSIPGSGTIVISALLTQMGCPLEYVPLFLVVDTIVDMVATTTTCVEAVVASLVVSARERQSGMNEYNQP